MKDERIEEISEHVDRLLTVDFHTRRFIIQLYDAARRAQGGKPLTYLASRALHSRMKRGSTVFFLAGFPTYGTFVAEQDGIVGAAMLARTLAELYEVKSIIMTDRSQAEMARKTLMGAGFFVVENVEDIVFKTQAVVMGFKEDQTVDARNMIRSYEPSAIVAIERPSRNCNNSYMSMKGLDLSRKIAKLDEFVIKGREEGVLTVGVADGGNETGCGLIREEVIKYHPNGHLMASCVPTDFLVFASASNLGAYGLAGALAAMNDDIFALPDPSVLRRALNAAAANGLHNGPPLWLDPGTDGIPEDLEEFVVSGIRRMVWEELNPHFPKFY